MKKLLIVCLIVAGALSRLLPHPANFSPVAALALFGGAYLPKKYAFFIPLSAMILSDLFLGFYFPILPFVYGSFILTTLIGLWLKNRKNPLNIASTAIISSLLFFLITNFGAWLDPISGYPQNLNGLIQSYVMGVPFYKNTFLGDLTYALLLFGGYELAQRFIKPLLPQKISQLIF